MAVGRDTLDELTCQHEDHDVEDCDGEMYFHSRCHGDAPTWAVYRRGELRVECSVCESEVVTVAVADKAPE